MIILGNPAKNRTKIRPLGPVLDLCLLKKKVSTCTILVFAYYPIIGGGCSSLKPRPQWLVQDFHETSPPRSRKPSHACCGLFSRGFG